jgi:hypothetical protein
MSNLHGNDSFDVFEKVDWLYLIINFIPELVPILQHSKAALSLAVEIRVCCGLLIICESVVVVHPHNFQVSIGIP